MKFSRRTLIILAVIGLLLIAARAALPFVVQRYVNQVLNQIPGYRGEIGAIDIKLWRGAYQIQDLRLQSLAGNVPVPFFEAKTVDLMIEWRALFHGAVAGQITFYQPKLNYVAGPTAAESQATIDRSWQERVAELFPLRLNRVLVVDGEIHFRNFHSEPQVDVVLDNVQAEALNLKNTRQKEEDLFSEVKVSGHPGDEASFNLTMRLDPLAPRPTFDLNGELLGFPLTRLNNYLMAYSGFELDGGQLDLYTELAAVEGQVTGYVKPILKNTGIKVWSGHESNPVQFVMQPLAALMSLAMKDWPQDQFATKIPVSGDFDNPSLHSWPAFVNLVKNAWVEAIEPGVDGTVDIQSAETSATTMSSSHEPIGSELPTAKTQAHPVR